MLIRKRRWRRARSGIPRPPCKKPGSAFTFYRNDALNANTWDNNRVGIKKGPFTQNIPGFTIGGPVLQNRMFFFGDFQATRTERTVTASASVPTARMRTGDLTELSGNMTANNPFVHAFFTRSSPETVAHHGD